MGIVRRWPRLVAILGNVPGAVALAFVLLSWQDRGRFDPGFAERSLMQWPAIGLAAAVAVALLLFAMRIAWLPLAIFDVVLAGTVIALAIITIVAEFDRRESGGLEGTLPWMVGGLGLLAAAFVAAALGVLVDRSRARRHPAVRAA